jgi:hypothetical protein
MTGDRVKRISKKFSKILGAFKNPTIINILSRIQFNLDMSSFTALGDPNGSPEEFWWHARMFFILYISAFREEASTPSITEFCLCGAMYMEIFQKLAVESGLWEAPFSLRVLRN